MIEICVENLSMLNLKEDIGHFRNLCQHTNMSLLENVLKALRLRSEALITSLESRETADSLIKTLSNENYLNNILLQEGGESHSEDLIFLANCEIEEIEV